MREKSFHRGFDCVWNHEYSCYCLVAEYSIFNNVATCATSLIICIRFWRSMQKAKYLLKSRLVAGSFLQDLFISVIQSAPKRKYLSFLREISPPNIFCPFHLDVSLLFHRSAKQGVTLSQGHVWIYAWVYILIWHHKQFCIQHSKEFWREVEEKKGMLFKCPVVLLLKL